LAQIIWTDAAIVGVAEIRGFIAKENPGAALRVAQELVGAADSLDHLPLRGAPIAGGRRRLTVGNYLILYRVDGDQTRVTILAVIDGRRLP